MTESEHRHYGSSTDFKEWGTPEWMLDGPTPDNDHPADEGPGIEETIGGFDLDAAAGAEPRSYADVRYTVEDDGLETDWFGDVWVNFPYGREENKMWSARIAEQAQSPAVESVTALVPASMGASWFQENFADADLYTVIGKRISFVGGDHNASFYSAIVSFFNYDIPTEYVRALNCMGMTFTEVDMEAMYG